jgi:hypothetical protein
LLTLAVDRLRTQFADHLLFVIKPIRTQSCRIRDGIGYFVSPEMKTL